MASVPHRVRGVKILKAVSSPLRLQILNLLFDKGSLSYTELMSSLKMNPSRDAGRFAYHLKFLLKADLMEADVETRKYCLTDMGKMVIDVADKIEKRAFRPKSLLVRTSRFTLEEFDVNKITNSLVREARMPVDLAQKVAKETEKRLLKSKTKYLTAPLVREIVNAILIEKDLEEYRHKLTRLGLPVHDVTGLMSLRTETSQGSPFVQEAAGETVLKEYMLLNVFPRDVADAHLSGFLHINDLGSWTLKPSEIMHDLRFFFLNGFNLEAVDRFQLSCSSPKTLSGALTIAFNGLLHSAKETGGTQTLDYFNVFLAPFVKGVAPSEAKECLREFILDVSQHVNACLGLELIVPDFLMGKSAVGASGKDVGKYTDFVGECQLLASLVLEVLFEQGSVKPILGPKVILKVRPEAFGEERAKEILLKAYQLSSNRGMVYFANLLDKERRHSVFSASGFRLLAGSDEDWEIDTLRAGCLGRVTVNLPRMVYQSGKDKVKFWAVLRERCEMAARALEIKDRALKVHGAGLLPFLMQKSNGDSYFRLEKSACVVSLAGLEEAVEAFHEKDAKDEEKKRFAEELAENVVASMRRLWGKRRRHLVSAVLPDAEASQRLARLDVERYGVGRVRFSGTREKPFYSTVDRLTLPDSDAVNVPLGFSGKARELRSGGSLTVVELGEAEHEPEELLSFTKEVFEKGCAEFLTYNRRVTYCMNCKKSWVGLLHKCPSCGSTGTLTAFDGFTAV